MNIIIVSSDCIPHIGGKSTHIMDLKKGMEEKGHKVKIISANSVPKFIMNIIRIILMPIRMVNKRYYLYYASNFLGEYISKITMKECKNNRIDCVIAQDAAILTPIAKKLKHENVSIFLTMHTYFAIEATLDNNEVSDNLFNKILNYELQGLNQVNGIICVDNRICEHVNEYIEKRNIERLKGKVEVISNFTDTERFKPVNKNVKIELREKYNVDKDRFVCVCARRLVEKNGVIYAIKSMEHLGSEILLLIVGDGPQKQNLYEYVDENKLKDKVRFINGIDNEKIQEIYQLADVSIIPSITINGLQEATSITAIESMSCGIPTIASNIGGLRQLIDNDRTGILVDEKNSESIVDAITKLSRNKKTYNEISEACNIHIIKKHSHIKSAESYLEKYRKFNLL